MIPVLERFFATENTKNTQILARSFVIFEFSVVNRPVRQCINLEISELYP
jgi:hypothetical protein